jgi:hypothetical protein
MAEQPSPATKESNMAESLKEIWNKTKKPFKAKKVLSNKRPVDSDTKVVPIGTKVQVIDEVNGKLNGIVLTTDGKEEPVEMSNEEKVWEKI